MAGNDPPLLRVSSMNSAGNCDITSFYSLKVQPTQKVQGKYQAMQRYPSGLQIAIATYSCTD